jgi:orotate phosphoribosyltransferase
MRDGLLHTHLSQYKNSASIEVRTKATNALAALTANFFSAHLMCIGEFDVVTTIPSQRRDSASIIVQSVLNLEPLHRTTLEATRPNNREIDPTRFNVLKPVAGDRVLLFDDTFTTGSSLFSAAQALSNAGAKVTRAVVIGRHFRTDFEPSKLLWKWLKDRTWDQRRCARCNGETKHSPTLF